MTGTSGLDTERQVRSAIARSRSSNLRLFASHRKAHVDYLLLSVYMTVAQPIFGQVETHTSVTPEAGVCVGVS